MAVLQRVGTSLSRPPPRPPPEHRANRSLLNQCLATDTLSSLAYILYTSDPPVAACACRPAGRSPERCLAARIARAGTLSRYEVVGLHARHATLLATSRSCLTLRLARSAGVLVVIPARWGGMHDGRKECEPSRRSEYGYVRLAVLCCLVVVRPACVRKMQDVCDVSQLAP